MKKPEEPIPVLECGARLTVRGDESDGERTAIVVQLKHGLIWISRCEAPGEAGERVVIERRVEGDASYQATARVEFLPPETYALRRIGEWHRRQRRADVRVSTYGLELTVIRLPAAGEPALERFSVADLSAGGLSIRGVGSFEAGEEVRCVFELPGERQFDLFARVVRCSGSGDRGRVGFQFFDVDHEHHSMLLQWVYREQARRYREEKERQKEKEERGER